MAFLEIVIDGVTATYIVFVARELPFAWFSKRHTFLNRQAFTV